MNLAQSGPKVENPNLLSMMGTIQSGSINDTIPRLRHHALYTYTDMYIRTDSHLCHHHHILRLHSFQVQPYSLVISKTERLPPHHSSSYVWFRTSYLFPFPPKSLQASAFPTIRRLRIWSRNMYARTYSPCPHDRKRIPMLPICADHWRCCFSLKFVNRLHFSYAVAIYRFLWSRFILVIYWLSFLLSYVLQIENCRLDDPSYRCTLFVFWHCYERYQIHIYTIELLPRFYCNALLYECLLTGRLHHTPGQWSCVFPSFM